MIPSAAGPGNRQAMTPHYGLQQMRPYRRATEISPGQASDLNNSLNLKISQQHIQQSKTYKSFSLSRQLSLTEEDHDAHKLPSFSSSSEDTEPYQQQSTSVSAENYVGKVASVSVNNTTITSEVRLPPASDMTQIKIQNEEKDKRHQQEVTCSSLIEKPVRKTVPTPLDLAPPQFVASLPSSPKVFEVATLPKSAPASKTTFGNIPDTGNQQSKVITKIQPRSHLSPTSTTTAPTMGSSLMAPGGPSLLDVRRIIQQQLGGGLPMPNGNGTSNKHVPVVRASALYDYELELYDDYMHSSGGSEASTPRVSSVQSWGDRTSSEINVDQIRV